MRLRPAPLLRALVASALLALTLSACSNALEGDQVASGPVAGPIDGVGSLGDGAVGDIGPELGCDPECAPGYDCFPGAGGGVCLPAADFACAPCVDDVTCLGGRCVALDGDEGASCLIPCAETRDGATNCPAGFACVDASDQGSDGGEGDGGDGGDDGDGEGDGAPLRVCVPTTNSCTCREGFDGATRSCTAVDGVPALGVCAGAQVCVADEGWSGATASTTTATARRTRGSAGPPAAARTRPARTQAAPGSRSARGRQGSAAPRRRRRKRAATVSTTTATARWTRAVPSPWPRCPRAAPAAATARAHRRPGSCCWRPLRCSGAGISWRAPRASRRSC